MDTIPVRVRAVAELTDRIRTYELVAAERGAPLPPFTAGAHIGLRLPSGAERHYSLHNDPAERHRYAIAVQREDGGRGGSAEVHRALHVGDVLHVTPPRNLFPLADGAAHSLLVAGGIGITPILSMARALRREGRPFTVVYLARSADGAAFLDELAALAGEGARIVTHFDEGDAARAFDLAAALAPGGPDDHVYCCGPAGLMAAVKALAAAWPEDRVHFEHFSNDEAVVQAGDRPFEVRLARSGRTVAVGKDETMLAALLAAGIDVDYSCCEGTCGTCIVPLVEGEADHRDKVLLPSERAGSIVLCCSRAKGAALTVDL